MNNPNDEPQNKWITPEEIASLADNECFVFGSNLAGRHGKGAALVACQKFGAIYGVGSGPTGQCYALPTKDGDLRPRTLHAIRDSVRSFLIHARLNPGTHFLVTKVGCGHAGYIPRVMGCLFTNEMMPDNVALPIEFWATHNNPPATIRMILHRHNYA